MSGADLRSEEFARANHALPVDHYFVTSQSQSTVQTVYYAPRGIQHFIPKPAPFAAVRSVVVARARRTLGARGHAIVGMLMVALTATMISACGSSKNSHSKTVNLNIAHVEQSIEQSILSERHLRAKVTCPAAVSQEKGKIFTCSAAGTSTTGKHGKHTTPFTTLFTVTVQNSQGYVTYHS